MFSAGFKQKTGKADLYVGDNYAISPWNQREKVL
jgi:hypothetical protein